MTDENVPSGSPVASILGFLVLVFVIVEVVIFLLMGGSSVATEPNPIFGNLFSLVAIVVIVVLAVSFMLIVEKIQKEAEDVRGSDT